NAAEPAAPGWLRDLEGQELPWPAIARFGSSKFQCGEATSKLVVSPDGQTFAASGQHGTLALVNAADGNLIVNLLGHRTDHEVKCVAFSPDGHSIISASRDGSARQWDTLTQKELRCIVDDPSK